VEESFNIPNLRSLFKKEDFLKRLPLLLLDQKVPGIHSENSKYSFIHQK